MAKTKETIKKARRPAIMGRVGEAIVAWSKVEAFWTYIFRDLVYFDIGEKGEFDRETGIKEDPADSIEKSTRADAIYFSLSSEAQRTAISPIANVVLAKKPELLTKLRALMKRTRTLAKDRNAIVHANYDQYFVVDGTKFRLLPLAMRDLGPFKKAPDIDLGQATQAFEGHADDLLSLWTEIYNDA